SPHAAGRSRGRCAACRGSPVYPRTRTRLRSLGLLVLVHDLGVDDVLIVSTACVSTRIRGWLTGRRGLLLGVEGLAALLAGGVQLGLGGLDRLNVLPRQGLLQRLHLLGDLAGDV